MEFEWNIFPGFNTLQLSEEVKSLLLRLGETPENFTGIFFHVDVQRHLLWIKRQWRRMSGICSTRISVCKKIWKWTMVIHWSWFWEKAVLYQLKTVYMESGTKLQMLEFAESGRPIVRATTPLSRGQLKSKGHGKTVDTLQPTRKRLRLFFA